MSTIPQENQVQNQQQQNHADNSKELNFRQLQEKYERQIAQERSARMEAERVAKELQERKQVANDDDEDDGEPYVDTRKLNKKLAKFGEQTQKQTQSEIQRAVQMALEEERKKNWMKNNPDFYDIMQHADKFAQADEELAETILSMPEGFDRQKLVYKTIKAMGLHKPPEDKKSGIQDKIEANRRSPYYQPSGVGTAPYASTGDFSSTGQQQAYNKMKELQKKMRLG